MTLPQGWAKTNFSESATARMGKTILAKELTETGLPVFSAATDNSIWGYVTKSDVVFRRGTIVVSARGTIGAPKIPDVDEFVSTQTTIAIAPSEAWETKFLAEQLRTVEWSDFTATTTIPMLTIGALNKIQLSLPPLAEQRRIVAKLDALTVHLVRARAELDRVPVMAARLRKTVLAEIFSPSNLARWQTVRMEDRMDEGLIGLVRSKTEQGNAGVPYIRMNHYDLDGRINEEKLTFVHCSVAELARFQLQPGDVLFNTRNSVELVGKVTIWPHDMPGRVYNNNILRLRFQADVDPHFAFRYMMSPYFRDLMEQEKSATTSVAAIYQRSLYAAPMPVPSKDEQVALTGQIEAAFARADRLEAEAARSRALLDRLESALLAKAFRGELVPQNPNDEPAQVLLDRIRAQRGAAPKTKRGRSRGLLAC
ncbi:MAG: restriction endonuclease subunit S [Croceibacterium sp.]